MVVELKTRFLTMLGVGDRSIGSIRYNVGSRGLSVHPIAGYVTSSRLLLSQEIQLNVKKKYIWLNSLIYLTVNSRFQSKYQR